MIYVNKCVTHFFVEISTFIKTCYSFDAQLVTELVTLMRVEISMVKSVNINLLLIIYINLLYILYKRVYKKVFLY